MTLALLVAACSSTPASTTTTPTPQPRATSSDLLDWHIRFSTAQQNLIARCTITTFTPVTDGSQINDVESTVNLLPPTPLIVQATLITPGMAEAIREMLRLAASPLRTAVASYIESPTQISVLWSVRLLDEENLYRPVELSPVLHAEILRAPGEIEFFFDGSNSVQLVIERQNYRPTTSILRLSFSHETIYIMNFEVDSFPSTAQTMTLQGSLSVRPPFQNEVCDDNRTAFQLTLAVPPTGSNNIMSAYGTFEHLLDTATTERLRRVLLTEWAAMLQPPASDS